MHLVRSSCAAGWGLLSLALCGWADEPISGSTHLAVVSARSKFQDEALTPKIDDLPTDPAPANFLQYEPQNVPLANDPPPLINELPPVAVPYEPPRSLPPIVPYSTQYIATLNSGTGDNLGIVDLDLREVLVIPKVPGLMFTPGFATHILSGPSSTDLPAALYENWLEVRWLKKASDTWTFDLAIAPSLFTDYQNISDGAFRLPGRALAIYTHSPELQVMAGVLYLNREDIAALPMAGLIWTPNDQFKADLIFPRPRLMIRLSGDDTYTRWFYTGGEFGGGSYGIHRTDQLPGAPASDVVTYSVLRFLFGVETKRPRGFSPRIEAGFTFHRSIHYRSGIGDFDPGNAMMVRFGGSF